MVFGVQVDLRHCLAAARVVMITQAITAVRVEHVSCALCSDRRAYVAIMPLWAPCRFRHQRVLPVALLQCFVSHSHCLYLIDDKQYHHLYGTQPWYAVVPSIESFSCVSGLSWLPSHRGFGRPLAAATHAQLPLTAKM
mmetsp:Transcript_45534/g.75384  ORF Transcript_45534/g.75384 Transcript_45534/m.75384 type:complete len:138 (-) Transcript_45534:381-794(-)